MTNFHCLGVALQAASPQEQLGQGLSYSVPYLYGGLGFTGQSAFVNCADNDIQTFGNCSSLTICINEESIFLRDLQVRIPQRHIIVENSWLNLAEAFQAGKCNVIASESAVLIAASLRGLGYSGDLAIGKREYTSEMWGLKTLDSDPIWHNFLDATMMALLAAEQAGVTKEDAYRMGKTSIFGDEFEDMFINAVSAKGNYGEKLHCGIFKAVLRRFSLFRFHPILLLYHPQARCTPSPCLAMEET